MKLTIDREQFLAAAGHAALAVPSKSPKPVLESLHLRAGADGRVVLSATDLEVGLSVGLGGAEVQEPGEGLLPAGKLTAILRETTDQTLNLDAGAAEVRLHGLACEFHLPGEDPATFPLPAAAPESEPLQIDAEVLARMIRLTVFATDSGREGARFGATAGVLFQAEADRLRLVATDGRRLAVIERPCSGAAPKAGATVLPEKALKLALRALDAEGSAKLWLLPNEARLEAGACQVTTRLVEGRFPDWRRVLPKLVDGVLSVQFETGVLLRAVRQAALMATDETKRLDIAFDPQRKCAVLTAADSMVGKSRVELPLPSLTGSALTFGVDPKYLTEMLKVGDASEVFTWTIVAANKPALLTNASGDYRYVVVPLVEKK